MLTYYPGFRASSAIHTSLRQRSNGPTTSTTTLTGHSSQISRIFLFHLRRTVIIKVACSRRAVSPKVKIYVPQKSSKAAPDIDTRKISPTAQSEDPDIILRVLLGETKILVILCWHVRPPVSSPRIARSAFRAPPRHKNITPRSTPLPSGPTER